VFLEGAAVSAIIPSGSAVVSTRTQGRFAEVLARCGSDGWLTLIVSLDSANLY